MTKNRVFRLVAFAFLLFFTYLMCLITLQYIPIRFDVAFLQIKVEEIKLVHYQLAFFTHVYTSIFVLMFGLTQFSSWIRVNYTLIHRLFGKLYVLLILLFAAPSGFIMGIYGNGGFYAQLSFCLLAILWFYFTLQAYLKIRKKQFLSHQNYMILSYALTLSAISLRLFKWLISNTLALPPMDTYRIVVWLGWLFNLLVAFWVIRVKKAA
jgi:uncharacterized membrane protein